MIYRKLGRSDLQVSSLCLGTMTFGQQNSADEAWQQLDFALAQGINFIDTAEMYPVPPRAETCGSTERILGDWLRRQQRDRLVIATKAAGPRRQMPWIRGGPGSFDLENLHSALEGSLRRLQTDYIDLYQLHWPERNVPMFGQYQFDPTQETDALPIRSQLEALAKLVQSGKVRYIGVSNEHAWGVMEFLRLAREYDLPCIVSIQNCYNLINRSFEFSLAEIAFRENLALLAYSPLAFGHLSGKYLPGGSADGRATLFKGFAQRYDKPGVQPAVAAYAEIAARHGLSLVELALAFVSQRRFVTSTILGATSLAQLQQNVAACSKPLPEGALHEIEQVHLRHMNPAP